MEPISVTAIILSILAGLGTLLSRLRFRHCRCGCINSDCIRTPENTPPSTPKTSEHNQDEIYTNFNDYV